MRQFVLRHMILATMVAILLGSLCTAVTFAGGVIVKPKGSTYGEQPRYVTAPVYNGSYSEVTKSTSEFTIRIEDGCWRAMRVVTDYVTTRTYNWGTLTNVTTDTEVNEYVLFEFCV